MAGYESVTHQGMRSGYEIRGSTECDTQGCLRHPSVPQNLNSLPFNILSVSRREADSLFHPQTVRNIFHCTPDELTKRKRGLFNTKV